MAKRKITCFLAKGEETTSFEFTIGFRGALKVLNKAQRLLRDGWELTKVEGDPEIAGYFQQEISRYNADKEAYSVPMKEPIKLAAKVTKSEITETKLFKTVEKWRSKKERIMEKVKKKIGGKRKR